MSRTFLISLLAVSSCVAQMKVTGVMHTRNYSPALPASSSSNPNAQGFQFNGINYHSGPVMNDPNGVNVYLIWYGDWSKDTAAQKIVTDFVKEIGGSSYFNINTTYYDFDKEGQINPIRNKVNYGASASDNYSRGSVLVDQNIADITEASINSGKLPADPNGVYFVLSSADVIETSGFCVYYCAWHGWDAGPSVNLPPHPRLGNNLIDAFVGNPNQCAYSCAWEYQLPTPNNNVAGDGMVNMIAHELSEMVTDPIATGWWNNVPGENLNLGENADLCAWTFGNEKFLHNGSFYNLKLGQHVYLSQQIWVNANGGYCAMSWDQ